MSALPPPTPTSSIHEMNFFVANGEEAAGEELFDSSLPEGQNFKTASKQYSIVPKEQSSYTKEIEQIGKLYEGKHSPCMSKGEGTSPLEMMAKYASPFSKNGTGNTPKENGSHPASRGAHAEGKTQEGSSKPSSQGKSISPSQQGTQKGEHLSHSPISERRLGTEREVGRTNLHDKSQKNEKGETRLSLSVREWKREETKEWWEMRYHQRERNHDGQKRDSDDQSQEDEKALKISKSGSVGEKKSPTYAENGNVSAETMSKPLLPPPSLGIFALYYILTKMEIYSDGTSNFSYKKEIELIDGETTGTHQKRLDELKEAIKKEQEMTNWGVASKVFSWMASIFAIFGGIMLIASGVGAIAGAMLMVGGMIQLTSQIMELTGGWKKIAELLPGDDTEKKRAVITWMQIGIAVLCLILAGAGAILGGYVHVGEVMGLVPRMMLGGAMNMAGGVTIIGDTIAKSKYYNQIAEVRKYELQLTRLKHQRKDLSEQMELGVDRLEQLFEDLARALEFEEELFRAEQIINRR